MLRFRCCCGQLLIRFQFNDIEGVEIQCNNSFNAFVNFIIRIVPIELFLEQHTYTTVTTSPGVTDIVDNTYIPCYERRRSAILLSREYFIL